MNRLVFALAMMACGRRDATQVASPAVAATPEPIQLGAPLLRRPAVPSGLNPYGEPTTPWRLQIGAIAASADGTLLVTADRATGHDESGGAVVWDRRAAREVAILGDREVHAVAMTRDGARVAAVDASDRLRVWNRANRAPVRDTPLVAGLAVGFSPDGTHAVGVGRDVTVVLDLATGARREARHAEAATIATVAASGDRVAFASAGAVQVLAITDGGFPSQRIDAVPPVAALSLSPDGRTLGVGDASGVHLHDAATGGLLQTNPRAGGAIAALAMLSRTRYVIALPWLKLFDGSKESLFPPREDKILAFAPFADGRRVAAGGSGGAVRIWDLETQREERAAESHTGAVHCLTFPSPGELMSSGRWADREFSVRSWNIASRTSRAPALRGERLRGFDNPGSIDLAAATPDAGRALYNTSLSLIVLDREGREREIPRGGAMGSTASAFSANGRWLALGAIDGAVVRIDVDRLPDPEAILRWEAHEHDHEVYALAISDDGGTIVSVAGQVKIWRANGSSSEPPRLALALTEQMPYSGVVLDGADRAVISGLYGSLELWSPAAGKRVATLQAGTPAIIDTMVGALSADRRMLATGHLSGLVQLWDLASGMRIARMQRHGNSITAIAFSPDGARLATGDEDGVILLWPVADARRSRATGPAR